MAAPAATINTEREYVIDLTGTNVTTTTDDFVISARQANFQKGFSIVTGTLTAMSVTIFASNKDGVAKDVTNALVGAATLASDTGYVCDKRVPYLNLILRCAKSNATNAIALTAVFPR